MDEQSYSNKAVYSQYQNQKDQDWNIFDEAQIERQEPTSSQLEFYDSYKFGFIMTDFIDLLIKKVQQNKRKFFQILNENYGPATYNYYCSSERGISIFNSTYQLDPEFFQQDSFEQQQIRQNRSTINQQTAKILFNQLARRINYVKKMNLQAAFDNIQIHSLTYRVQQDQKIQAQLSVSDSQNPSFYVQSINQSKFNFDDNNKEMVYYQLKNDQQIQQLTQSQIKTEPFTPRSPPIGLKSYHKKRKNKQKKLQKFYDFCNSDNNKTQKDDQDYDSFCLSDREQSQLYCFDLQSIFNENQKQKTEPTTQIHFRTQNSYVNQSADSCSNLSPFSCFGRTNENYSPTIQFKKIRNFRFSTNDSSDRFSKNDQKSNIERIQCQQEAFEQDIPQNIQGQKLIVQNQNKKKSIFMMDDELFFTN